MRRESWVFLFYKGCETAGMCLICALLAKKCLAVCLTLCLAFEARRGDLMGFRHFRATLKISEVEPQCTLKILQSKTFEKAKPLLMVTVHTERSSCPCFAAALSGSPTESVRSWHGITFRRLMKDSRFSMKKAGRSADTTSCFFQAQE